MESSIIKGKEQLLLTSEKKIVQKAGLSMVIIDWWDKAREYCKNDHSNVLM